MCKSGELKCVANDGIKELKSFSPITYTNVFGRNFKSVAYDLDKYATDLNEKQRCISSGFSETCFDRLKCTNGKISCISKTGEACMPSGGVAEDINCNTCSQDGRCAGEPKEGQYCDIDSNGYPIKCKQCFEGVCTQLPANTLCSNQSGNCLTGCSANAKCSVPLNRGAVCGPHNACYESICDLPSQKSPYYNNTCYNMNNNNGKRLFDPLTKQCCGNNAPNAILCKSTETCELFEGSYLCGEGQVG
jgi:hypothetical protein